ncbi:MAG: thiamine pyrophosphate-binding protein [Candidatus Alcyoniella australis]|nr:thiamine pyrophosphate-binding protein [Candidatus Alcyoniella australis]
MTGAQALVRTLERLGVQRVFGIPGAQNLELFDELRDAAFDLVLPTHELCAAFMADATGRLTGKPGVLVVVPGPGVTNALTGLAEALLDSAPLLAIFCAVRSDLPKAFQLHQIPQLEVARPLCKEVLRAERVDEVAATIARGYQLACAGEPGPVAVELPFNVFMETGSLGRMPAAPVAPQLDWSKLEQIAARLRAVKRVGIYAGAGAFDASEDLIKLAETLAAPVATTISGKGVIPEDHPLSVGFGYGAFGSPLAQQTFAEVDLVLAVAVKFGEVATGSYGMPDDKPLIHIDINPKVLGANLKPELSLVADAAAALAGLLRILGRKKRERARRLKGQVQGERQAWDKALLTLPESPTDVTPERLVATLRLLLERDAIITTDSGNHMFQMVAGFDVYAPRSFIAPVDYQSMGYGVPAAVAAKLAFRDRQVAACVGDGCFLMTGLEVLTAVRESAPITIVLFNDGKLGLIAQSMRGLYRRETAVVLPQLDYRALAQGLGLDYVLIQSDIEIESGLSRALRSKRSSLVDARVNYERATRYFKGVARANVARTDMPTLLRMGARMVRRMVLGS